MNFDQRMDDLTSMTSSRFSSASAFSVISFAALKYVFASSCPWHDALQKERGISTRPYPNNNTSRNNPQVLAAVMPIVRKSDLKTSLSKKKVRCALVYK